ncbi:MAG: ATP-dependent DNA helicase [Gammaproteobacteria bacterium]|nr:ATP-dependent DNA helicase [Gammaproteobacteria bacterium]
MTELSALLADGGPFAAQLPGFSARPAQQQMAEAIAAALQRHRTLVIEAGTGIGKTFAYLVPLLHAGHQAVISTGSRALQDQLFHRDLPRVRRALASPARAALLKGRSNYLCHHRLQQLTESGLLGSRQQAQQLQHIREWAGRTRSGDIAEMAGIAEDSPLWPRLTSTTDNCLGQDCGHFAECHVLRARRAAQEAELVVINHHLLFSDLMLREQGFGELLPGAEALILDEAHQLPDIASGFFGSVVSARQFHDLIQDVELAQRSEAPDMAGLPRCGELLRLRLQQLRATLGDSGQRRAWQARRQQSAVQRGMAELCQAAEEYGEQLQLAAPRGKGLERGWQRLQQLQQRLAQYQKPAQHGQVSWYETSRHGFMLRSTPLDIAATFQQCMERYPATWIFTSATLTVAGRFDHFVDRLGLTEAATARWDSPFPYADHALLYVPQQLPQPSDSGYLPAVITATLPLISVCPGGLFLLFTSHRALQQAAQLLETVDLDDRRVLVQGSEPRHVLLERFRAHGRAVLLGTGSFWEGVDVRGAALSAVVIDKLPFAMPDDPVLQARAALVRERGGEPFVDEQLPQAVIALKQGAGRLIRDMQDQGVLMVCDPRLFSKPYGKVFRDSLPPMPLVRDWDTVRAFMVRLDAQLEQQRRQALGQAG